MANELESWVNVWFGNNAGQILAQHGNSIEGAHAIARAVAEEATRRALKKAKAKDSGHRKKERGRPS